MNRDTIIFSLAVLAGSFVYIAISIFSFYQRNLYIFGPEKNPAGNSQ